MSNLEIHQRKNEPADMWLLRALAKAIPLMNRNQLYALGDWLRRYAIEAMKEKPGPP